jgi:hypothetical protein
MTYTAADIPHLELMQSLAKATPEEAAKGMLNRYSSPAIAKEMAHLHKMDYKENDEQYKYWHEVYNIIGKMSPKKAIELSLDESILKLCSNLREQGMVKHADDLENKFITYKSAANTHLYRAHDEDGEDLVNQAHPKGDHNVADGELGDVETEISKHKKIVDIINKQPTGKLAAYVDQCKIVLGASFLAQAQAQSDPYSIALDAIEKYRNVYDMVKSKVGEDIGEGDQYFNMLKGILDKKEVHKFEDFSSYLTSDMNNLKSSIAPSMFSFDAVFSPGKQEQQSQDVQKYFPLLKKYSDRFSTAIKQIQSIEHETQVAQDTEEAIQADPEKTNVVQVIEKLNSLISQLKEYSIKVSKNQIGTKYINDEINEIKILISRVNKEGLTPEVDNLVAEAEKSINDFATSWRLV